MVKSNINHLKVSNKISINSIIGCIISHILVILLFRSHQVISINPVLDLNDTFSYLIDRKTGNVIEPRDYFNFDDIYAPNETYKAKTSAQLRNYHLLKAFDYANYFQTDHWHYTDPEDLKRSAYPVSNQTKCSEHLTWLINTLDKSSDVEVLFKTGEQHMKLMNYVDSFGRPEASTFFGHAIWVGSYYECLRTSVNIDKFQWEDCNRNSDNGYSKECQLERVPSDPIINTRYCIGKVRDIDWPQPNEDNYKPRITYKVGLCLPESCETLSINNHIDQISKLMKINFPSHWRSHTQLIDMFCLPDRRSPVRAISRSGKIVIFVVSAWVMTLFIATILYHCYKRHKKELKLILNQHFRDGQDHLSLEGHSNSHNHNHNHNHNNNNHCDLDSVNKLPGHRIALHSMSSSSLSSWLSECPKIIKLLKAISISENMLELCKTPILLDKKLEGKNIRVNLNSLDFIKCLCCIFVIFGHIVFIYMQHLTNIEHTIELSFDIYPRILISLFNFVDTFFIISGLLTAFFIFKRFNQDSFSNPIRWIHVSLLRLLRLSPVYILIFWFNKTLSTHLADGPLWDYGTDRHSMRGLCKDDHWWKSILYFGNWDSMQPICILPAWSIIVDSQYSLIIPPTLYLIMRHKILGYTLLIVAVIVSTLNMTWQLANQAAVKTSDMAQVRLHIYPLISRFAAEFYNTAFNRIGPVAIGILGGHILYLYDKGTIRKWPHWMRGRVFKLVLLLHVLVFILPTLGKLTENEDEPRSNDSESNVGLFIISNATIKPIWSLINTIFILRLVTDLRFYSIMVRITSHNVWHCLGKLCFASYLIHYEIILILLKSRHDGLVDPDWVQVGREFSFVFIVSSLLAYVIYILFEAPINNLVSIAFKRENQQGLLCNQDRVTKVSDDIGWNQISISLTSHEKSVFELQEDNDDKIDDRNEVEIEEDDVDRKKVRKTFVKEEEEEEERSDRTSVNQAGA